ncbi:hypothetical protein [uncultured Stenotrophomonas sp.]|uniref:hypothetical protein n=1 Tax=uncultured Stenotrophomonas sp. TaxID=165438 RepID=UPI0025DD4575|nr:hypothetical protein [uncultured Stenotrophomonas sp.]
MSHADTIGTIEHGGKTYEIDWPEDPGDETKRNEMCGFIYLGDVQVGECAPPGGLPLTNEKQVMDAAWDTIRDGETDDQQ